MNCNELIELDRKNTKRLIPYLSDLRNAILKNDIETVEQIKNNLIFQKLKKEANDIRLKARALND